MDCRCALSTKEKLARHSGGTSKGVCTRWKEWNRKRGIEGSWAWIDASE